MMPTRGAARVGNPGNRASALVGNSGTRASASVGNPGTRASASVGNPWPRASVWVGNPWCQIEPVVLGLAILPINVVKRRPGSARRCWTDEAVTGWLASVTFAVPETEIADGGGVVPNPPDDHEISVVGGGPVLNANRIHLVVHLHQKVVNLSDGNHLAQQVHGADAGGVPKDGDHGCRRPHLAPVAVDEHRLSPFPTCADRVHNRFQAKVIIFVCNREMQHLGLATPAIFAVVGVARGFLRPTRFQARGFDD